MDLVNELFQFCLFAVQQKARLLVAPRDINLGSHGLKGCVFEGLSGGGRTRDLRFEELACQRLTIRVKDVVQRQMLECEGRGLSCRAVVCGILRVPEDLKWGVAGGLGPSVLGPPCRSLDDRQGSERRGKLLEQK